MASRYAETKVVDYCFNPIHIVDDDKDIIVPCGKCDGCLLHKANEWSMRCGMEIEDTPVTIFGSLTYNNKYLPKLTKFQTGNSISWISDNSLNIRFNGVCDVLRVDGIIIDYNYSSIPVTNWDNKHFPIINYASKRDIQLWLKLLRKDLQDYGIIKDKRIKKRGYFRYFIIAEVGPTTLRNHYHFLLFCQSHEVASYLLEGSLYKNWQMCDEDRFTPYVHVCDSGARGYVTQYLTCFSDLPNVYAENKEIRPFRLASKSPAIGYVGQNEAQVYQDVERGIIHYSRPVKRLEFNALLEYPKNYTASLFPKCYRFNKISDSRRCRIYGYLYRTYRKTGIAPALLRKRFCEIFNASDYLAMCACFRFCKDFVASPDYYYYLLDMYYYKVEMEHLKNFYLSQQEVDFFSQPYKFFEYYSNIEQICCTEPYDLRCIEFLTDFGIDLPYLVDNRSFFLHVRKMINDNNDTYRREVQSIVQSMVKMSKFNELTGNAPTNV